MAGATGQHARGGRTIEGERQAVHCRDRRESASLHQLHIKLSAMHDGASLRAGRACCLQGLPSRTGGRGHAQTQADRAAGGQGGLRHGRGQRADVLDGQQVSKRSAAVVGRAERVDGRDHDVERLAIHDASVAQPEEAAREGSPALVGGARLDHVLDLQPVWEARVHDLGGVVDAVVRSAGGVLPLHPQRRVGARLEVHRDRVASADAGRGRR